MDYKKIHDKIILRSNGRISYPNDLIYETHHIIPKCLGGTNDPANLAVLTIREHWLIHRMLAVIYPDIKVYSTIVKTCFHSNTSKNHVETRKALSLNASAYSKSISNKLSTTMSNTNKEVLWKDSKFRERHALRVADPVRNQKLQQGNYEFTISGKRAEHNRKLFKDVPKKRCECNICGQEVSVNTLALHKRSASCVHFNEIKELLNNNKSQTSISKQLKIDERAVRRVRKHLMK